jgi:hypothetical protein
MAITTLSLLITATGAAQELEAQPEISDQSFATLGGTGYQDDVDDAGLYAALRWSRLWFPGRDYVNSGDHVALEAGVAINDTVGIGALIDAGTHDVEAYFVQAYYMPDSSGPLGDFQMLRLGAVGRARFPIGPVYGGGRVELLYATWRSPFDEAAYQEEVLPNFGGVDRPMHGAGAWIGGAAEVALPLADPGPALLLSGDLGFLATAGLGSPILGLSIGITTPF